MVRGNWQKRVETAEARRTQARQRKQKAATASVNKHQAAQLVRHLSDAAPLVSRWDLIVYADTAVEDEKPPPIEQPKRITTRPRSDSHPPKKAHPRSKASSQPQQPPPDADAPVQDMCRSYFFTGTCGLKKGKRCQWQHLDVLCATDTTEAAAAVPHPEDTSNPPGGSMECAYRLHPPLRLEDTLSVSEQWTAFLALHGLKLANIVYVVQNRVLLFDRHRGGWLFDGVDDYADAVQGRCAVRTTTTTRTRTENQQLHLPGAVLEHILLFLPDTAVGIACQVCRKWRNDIGSPALWRHLLERHQWPLGTDDDPRTAFVCHTSAVRDLHSLVAAASSLLLPPKRQQHEATMDFGGVAHAPVDSRCVAVLEWSPGVVLAAFDDNSIRLWHTANNGGQIRELLCQVVDPYIHTKRRTSRIVAVALDGDVLGCLCRVEAPMVDVAASYAAFLLVVIRREDFVVGDSASVAVEHMTVLDVGQCVLDEILMTGQSEDIEDDRLATRVMEFVTVRDVGEVNVLASPSLAALGHGRFLVHASVSVPGDDESDEDDGASSQDQVALTEGRLVVISSHAEAVVWTATQADGLAVVPNVSLAAHGSTFTAGSPDTDCIVLGSLEDPVVHCTVDTPATLGSEWVTFSPTRPMVVSGSSVVAVDSFNSREEETFDEKAVVVIYPLNPQLSVGVRTVILEGNVTGHDLFSIRGDHVVVVCSERHGEQPTEGDVQTATWITKLIVIHLSSGLEVFRCDLDFPSHSLRMVPNGNQTLAMVINYYGAAMTGNDVREQPGHFEVRTNPRTPSSKKKKKRQPNRGSKKDGFARGMSLRG